MPHKIKEDNKPFNKYIRNKRVDGERLGPRRIQKGNPSDVDKVLHEYFSFIFIKEKDMEDGKFRVVDVDNLDQFTMMKEEVFDVMGFIRVDSPQYKVRSIPSCYGKQWKRWRGP